MNRFTSRFAVLRFAVLVAALAAAPLGAAASRDTASRDESTREEASADEALALLLASVEPDDRVAAQLAGLGAGLAARVVEHVRPNDERPAGRQLVERDWKRIEAALDRLPRAASARALEPSLAVETDAATALIGLRLLGSVGSGEQAELFTKLLSDLAVTSVRRGTTSDAVQASATAIQRRDRSFSRALASRKDSLPAIWYLPIARVLAIGEGNDDLELIWSTLARTGPGEHALLALVGEVADRYAGRIPESRLAQLRTKLRAVDVTVVELAAVALGRLGDDASAEQFVAFMTQANERVRAAGHWGLRELSGLPTGPQAERWEIWLDASRAWWDTHGSELGDELRWGAPEVVTARIVEIAAQRLRRRELIEALSTVFERDEEELVDLAIRGMSELRWNGTRRHLVALLSHPSARVQGRAWRALREMTGFDAGPDPESWRLALCL